MNALLIVCGLAFLSLIAEIINIRKGLYIITSIGLLAAAIVVALDWNLTLHHFNNMLVFDNFSIAFTALIAIVAFFWFCISREYFVNQSHQTDRSALVVFTVVGGIMMVSFYNMAMLFLGIEILSISLYVLTGSSKDSFFSNEASFKYFIMGSFATGFLLMGIALIYGATGSFDIGEISLFIEANKESLPGFFYGGMLLMLVGIAFKISAVPFHFWAPDVYSGSPTLITAFMSTVVKIAAVGAFFKIFSQCFLSVQASLESTIQVIIVLTLVVANITAVFQDNVKRMLAYSSIAHVGYILLGFISGSLTFGGTLFYYLTSYSAASLTAFAVAFHVEKSQGTLSIEAFHGLAKKSSFAAVALTIALLSLAGIPPLAGFFAKYSILARAIDAHYIPLVVLGVVASLVGVYYYFRVIIAMFGQEPKGNPMPISPSLRLILGIITAVIFILGLFPDWMIQLLA
jgi:NADH-quinone oxidoreductase subunit N